MLAPEIIAGLNRMFGGSRVEAFEADPDHICCVVWEDDFPTATRTISKTELLSQGNKANAPLRS